MSAASSDLNLLDSMSFGTVSFEELLGHCNEVFKKNQSDLAQLEERLKSFGYVPGTLSSANFRPVCLFANDCVEVVYLVLKRISICWIDRTRMRGNNERNENMQVSYLLTLISWFCFVDVDDVEEDAVDDLSSPLELDPNFPRANDGFDQPSSCSGRLTAAVSMTKSFEEDSLYPYRV